jgi:aminopeptidase YwaD
MAAAVFTIQRLHSTVIQVIRIQLHVGYAPQVVLHRNNKLLNLAKRLIRQPVLLLAIVFIAAACSNSETSVEPAAQPASAPTETVPASAPASETATPALIPTTQPTVEPSPTSEPSPIAIVPQPTPTPATVPTSVPKATETPIFTPSATPVTAPSEIVAYSSQAMAFLEELTTEFSPRQSATDQELMAAEFLASEFEALGYETTLQPFTVEIKRSTVELESSGVEILPGFRTFPLTSSIETSVSGFLVSAGKAFVDDVSPGNLTGKVVLIERGTLTFMAKVNRVADAGAVGAIIFNNTAGMFRGTFAEPPSIPAVSISREDGLAILEFLNQGEISVTVTVETVEHGSQNVVAVKPGTATNSEVVILGGHYDTIEGVPGANDNGSGSATVVTISQAIADMPYPFDIRFVLFGSEELGLKGSRYHLAAMSSEEQDQIIAMFNFDALGTGDTIGVLGDRPLVDEAISLGEIFGISVGPRFNLANATSDHAPFREADIPVIFFLADDISRIHTPEDKLEFIQPELMGGSAVIGIELLDALAEE